MPSDFMMWCQTIWYVRLTVLPHSLALFPNLLWPTNGCGKISLWGSRNCPGTLGYGWFSTQQNTENVITCVIPPKKKANKDSGVEPTKQHILLGYCLGGPHGQFGCLGGSGYLPCGQIEVEIWLKTLIFSQKWTDIQTFLLFFHSYYPGVFCPNYS